MVRSSGLHANVLVSPIPVTIDGRKIRIEPVDCARSVLPAPLAYRLFRPEPRSTGPETPTSIAASVMTCYVEIRLWIDDWGCAA